MIDKCKDSGQKLLLCPACGQAEMVTVEHLPPIRDGHGRIPVSPGKQSPVTK